ncbi:hypothetical protein GCM10017691_23980 [Pseudonocardia petroleophila]|uniref:Ig-like domain-containing protein n=1 Tax=Pseudonocardia petroleophila TaxID=37331 RepID=A0A7G7MFU5_9PSEU|nr:hypothetical protein [Pseudonocardia petroleophila]QNG51656.1 hypothetical protein H6H00_26710 [Pseudonocardia petroleophila]
MAAGKWTPNPVIDRGSVWRTNIRFTDAAGVAIPIQSPGWMDVRTRPERSASLVVRLDSAGDADGLVSFGPDTNQATLFLSAASTSDIAPGEYYFDLFVSNQQGEAERLVFGIVEVRGEVSLP